MLLRTGRRIGLCTAAICVFLTAVSIGPVAAAPAVTVTASVASHHVFVGGTVRLQVRVKGSDHPGKPQFPPHHGFSASFRGGSADDSTSITIINGNETTIENTGYVYSYSLSPKHSGSLTIPGIVVEVNGKSYRTDPIRLTVSRPQKTTAFLLDLSLSRHVVYVGEPVVLTVDWYISRNVSSVNFNLPILQDGAFQSKRITVGRSRQSTVQLPLGKGRVTATRSNAVENGRSYTRISFKRLLIPRMPGSYDFANSSVDFVTQSSSASVFGSFFGSPPSQRTWVIPGTTLRIDVKKLPAAGRPVGFTGLVGSNFSLSATATPKIVNVGDPISLEITLKGGAGIEDAEVPPLSTMPGFGTAFSLPAGRPPGALKGDRKIFTQTIRAKSDRVVRIPPVDVPYFDPSSGSYAILRSRAIGIRVRPTHILTAKDLQGVATSASASSSVPQISSGGIDYNYEGRDLLTRGAYSPAVLVARPGPAAIAAAPLAAFLVLFGFTRIRERSGGARRGGTRGLAREVLSLCGNDAERRPEVDAIFAAFRRYLRARFDLPTKAPDYSDVRPRLTDPALSARIAGLYSLHDELRFAPDGVLNRSGGVEQLSSECAAIVSLLERSTAR